MLSNLNTLLIIITAHNFVIICPLAVPAGIMAYDLLYTLVIEAAGIIREPRV